ncbi:hypothetical protein PR048_023767 [Dryococelus australis]|uniref:Uncharacterized protein n=1 Tax=Dryococelus australis TaxID=614101 RepID=A0ABQ9GV31_9NEOP|nr:hypothetical protein PR048_023767 [Dryococelus australis]
MLIPIHTHSAGNPRCIPPGAGRVDYSPGHGIATTEHVNCNGSSFESQDVMPSIPPATSVGTDSADDCDETVSAKDGMSSVDIDDNYYEDNVDEDDDDILDALTHPSTTFAATNDMKKAEDFKNVRYIFPEDPNELVYKLRYLIDLQKRCESEHRVHIVVHRSLSLSRSLLGVGTAERRLSVTSRVSERVLSRRVGIRPESSSVSRPRTRKMAAGGPDVEKAARHAPGNGPVFAVLARTYNGPESISIVYWRPGKPDSSPQISDHWNHGSRCTEITPGRALAFLVSLRDSGAVMAERLACSQPTKADQSPAGFAPGILQVVIVPDNAAGRRVFSGISRLGADEGESKRVWSSAEMKGRRKRDISKETRRPSASYGNIPTCENLGATQSRLADPPSVSVLKFHDVTDPQCSPKKLPSLSGYRTLVLRYYCPTFVPHRNRCHRN